MTTANAINGKTLTGLSAVDGKTLSGLSAIDGISVGIAPIQPDAPSGLLGWWKADAIGGLSNNDPVTTWPDSSSNANDMGFLSHQALYKTNVQNSLPAVLFNGTSDLFQSANNVTGIRQFFIVYKYTAATFAGFTGLFTYNGNGSSDSYIILTGDSGLTSWYFGSLGTTDPPRSTYKLNGVANTGMPAAMNTCGISSATTSTGTISVSDKLRIGVDRTNGGAGRWWGGYVMEIYIYNVVQSSGTEAGLIQYAINKWAIV